MRLQICSAFGCVVSIVGMICIASVSALADDASWKTETIADALLAAPPSVTNDATVLGWSSDGKLVVARFGSGPYTCIASGSFSLRFGKPPLPYPDPMCLDENSWAFIQALWAGKDKNELPTAPGLIWMLAGMNVAKSAVGASAITSDQAGEAGAGEIVQMTPHVMILPLPFAEQSAHFTTKYNLDEPLNSWIMAAGKPHEHLMVHFSAEDTMAMMNGGE